MAQDPYKYFRPEARDLVDQFAKGVLDLERGEGGAGAVRRLLRVAHTLKGAARVVRQSEIAERAHAIEDALAPFRDGAAGIAREAIDTILEHVDEISARLAAIPEDQELRRPIGKAERADVPRTVRADIIETDSVLEGIAEVHALLDGLRAAAQGLEQARHLAELLEARPLAAGEPEQRAASALRRRRGIAEELCGKCGSIERNLSATIDQMDRELRQLREAAERLRLAAAGSLFTALERAARDAARTLAKEVAFEGVGGDIRLDSDVLEAMQGALIQIVRNAVAHGIESPAERRAAGKPVAGHISIEVTQRGRHIMFGCRDDGRGVDLDAIRRVARARNLFDPGAPDPEDQALLSLLLKGGISTSGSVTDVSGRGVGLDVVRESVERLGGEVSLRTERGIGTTIELVIPSSLTALQALSVGIAEADGGAGTAYIPLAAVRRSLRITPDQISRGAKGDAIIFEQQAVPFVPLGTLLGDAPGAHSTAGAAVVLSGSQGLAAVGIDRLLGTAGIVVRPLPDTLQASPIVGGTTLDAGGNPRLVLDADGLVAAALQGVPVAPAPAPTARPVLVVDDSLTTRMLEQSILESAGYEVDLAISAEEALEILRRKRYALILVDVEMPGMDGFTFIERLRADPSLRDTPAILVTSRASPEDLARGRAAGANGHIVKSEFDQTEFMTMIKAMVV